VGAVAVDARGNVAAATSTGGLTGKFPGRVGDTPGVGHGVFADDESVGVSCTGESPYEAFDPNVRPCSGEGEAFMKAGVARRVSTNVLAGMDPEAAIEEALGECTHGAGLRARGAK